MSPVHHRTSVPASPGDAVKGCHLPRSNELAPAFKENGVGQVICMAVNDPFVMEEWAKARTVPQLFVNGELIGGGENIGAWVKRRTVE